MMGHLLPSVRGRWPRGGWLAQSGWARATELFRLLRADAKRALEEVGRYKDALHASEGREEGLSAALAASRASEAAALQRVTDILLNQVKHAMVIFSRAKIREKRLQYQLR